MARRTGKVFADRFHAHVLRNLREVEHATWYVLENFRHHLREDVAPRGVDPCTSAGCRPDRACADSPFSAPETWLMRVA